MNWKCLFGHRWVECGRKQIRGENWKRTSLYEGLELSKRDIVRVLVVTVEKCSKCGAKGGLRYYTDDPQNATELDATYAEEIIAGTKAAD